MIDYDAQEARLLEVAKARLSNRPDLIGRFERDHLLGRVCGVIQLHSAGASLFGSDVIDIRLCQIVDEWAEKSEAQRLSGRPPRVAPLPEFGESVKARELLSSGDLGVEVEAEKQAASAPAMAVPEPVAAPVEAVPVQRWTVRNVRKFPGYRVELNRLLRAAHAAGSLEPPTAQNVLDAWAEKPPYGITRVMPDGFDYLDGTGAAKEANRDAIRKAIGRMVDRTTSGR